MAVFIDASGKYYQAKAAKDSGDAKIEHPTKQMLEHLTETPVTAPDFGRGVLEKEIKKLNTPSAKALIAKASDAKPEVLDL